MNKKFINLFVLFCLLANLQTVYAQHLHKRITLTAKNEALYKVLNRIEEQGNFSFSYSGSLFNKDSLVNLSLLNAPVWEVLNRIFVYNVEYRETGNYIVLRSAIHRFSIYPDEIAADRRKYKISGYVLDERTGQGVKDASVYEKKLLKSALTDEKGYFSLQFRGEHTSAMLTVSKEYYRDTTMFFLSDVKVKPQGYYDDRKTGFLNRNFNNAVERFGINKLLVSSKRRIQSLNIPDFFANSPFQASFLPGFGSQGLMSSQVVNKVSLNVLGGYSGGVNGAEAAGLFNITKNDVKSFQMAGIFNIAGGSVTGMQASGISNTVFGKLDGVQIAGCINHVKDTVKGVQIAGIANRVQQNVKGIQFTGLANHNSKDFEGVQIAGLLNMNRKVRGIQIAGLVNINRGDIKGVQLSGVLNNAKNVNGLQIGLINMADSSSGIGFGLLNLYRTGYHKVSLYIDEVFTIHTAVKTGNAKLYTILSAGANLASEHKFYSLGFGLGHDVKINEKLMLNLTGSSNVFFADKKSWFPVSYKFSPAVEYSVTKKLNVFTGLSYNVFLDDSGKHDTEPIVKVYPDWYHRINNTVKGWIGGNFGVGISL